MNKEYESGTGNIILENVGQKETIVRQHIELCFEEMQTLMQGNTIALLENDEGETILMIKGCKEDESEIDEETGYTKYKREALREDILHRYDNAEYWENDIIDNEDYN